MFTFIVTAIAAALLFAFSPLPSRGHEGVIHDGCPADQTFTAGEITVTGAFSRATLPEAPVAAGYLTITNLGQEPDRLISASSSVAPTVELHSMSANADGMMTMEHLPAGIDVPPGETVTLGPGGLHIMFIGPNQPFSEGECIEVTLEFEKAGELPVRLSVGPVGAREAPSGHEGH